MAETRMTLTELKAELDKVNEEIDRTIDRLEDEGITEEVTEEVEVIEEASEDVDEEITEEDVEELAERKSEIVQAIEKAEKREKTLNILKEGQGEVVESFEERGEKMDKREVRGTAEYKNAFAEYIKADMNIDKISAEQRALLTENAGESGTIAVPVGAQERINTAWENDEIMRRITRTFFKGNLKVGYEDSSDGAVVHTEGGEAVTPENLVIDYVELIPSMLKKVVEVSDEVLANNSAMVDYLYDEIQYQITKLASQTAVSKAVASSLTASYTLAGATPTTADIVSAAGLLGGEATEPVVITTRSIAAQIKAATLSASYGYDAFDGMPVLYTDAAALNGAPFIIADLSGIQANFPEGDDAKFKFDDYTKADQDLVRIIGRLYVGIDVVAKGKVVKAVTSASE